MHALIKYYFYTRYMRTIASVLVGLCIMAAYAAMAPHAYAATCTGAGGSVLADGDCRIYLTSGTSFTVPTDWNSASNTIEVIGGGGGGDSNFGWAGGGGGAYALISNLSLSGGGSVTYRVGAGGTANAHNATTGAGGDSYFNGTGTTCSAQSVCAKGGKAGLGSSSAGGAGGNQTGNTGSVGTLITKGGTGFNGGGGAGGQRGDGVTATGSAGGAGDAGFGGAGGTGSGVAGGNGTEWDASHGSGGGGGGNTGFGGTAATGGNYGGGGGAVSGGGVVGKQGIVVITYSFPIPVVTTSAASSITSSTATLNGSVTTNGGSGTQRGFAYSTDSTLSSGVSTSTLGSFSDGSFNTSISSLSPNTIYYVRAYATDGFGTGYGSIVSFTTSVAKPTVTTSAASSITTTGATLNGNITDTGGQNGASTQYGFAYSTDSALASGVSTTSQGFYYSTGAYTYSLSGLIGGVTYYFRAYASNPAGGTGYGSIQSFTAGIATLSVTTGAATGVFSTTATLNGTITNPGGSGSNATQYGFAYSTNSSLSSGVSTTTLGAFSGSGSITNAITSLSNFTTYYYRAYATNGGGTYYGSIQSFSSVDTAPARKLIIFPGFKIRIVSGTVKLYQQ